MGWISGGIAALGAAAAGVAWRSRRRFAARIAAHEQRLRGRAPATTHSALPAPLAAFAARCGLPEHRGRAWIRIEQRGEMRQEPDQPWRPFTAIQTYAVATPEFVWRARFGVVHVLDEVVDGRGTLEARLCGAVPVARAGGADTTRAELQRYLAEVPWVPTAIAGNPHLTWRAIDATTVVGRVRAAELAAELQFAFDPDGDIVRVHGERSRHVRGRSAVPTPWHGHFSDYTTIDGMRLPRRAEVGWTVAGAPFACWRGEITAVQLSDASTEPGTSFTG